MVRDISRSITPCLYTDIHTFGSPDDIGVAVSIMREKNPEVDPKLQNEIKKQLTNLQSLDYENTYIKPRR